MCKFDNDHDDNDGKKQDNTNNNCFDLNNNDVDECLNLEAFSFLASINNMTFIYLFFIFSFIKQIIIY